MTPDERFAALFERIHRPLLAYALRRVSDPADAADVVAETFLVAWRRLDDVPAGEAARPWLFGVARRVLANHYRGERRRDALADRLRDQLTEVVVESDEPEAPALVARTRRCCGCSRGRSWHATPTRCSRCARPCWPPTPLRRYAARGGGRDVRPR